MGNGLLESIFNGIETYKSDGYTFETSKFHHTTTYKFSDKDRKVTITKSKSSPLKVSYKQDGKKVEKTISDTKANDFVLNLINEAKTCTVKPTPPGPFMDFANSTTLENSFKNCENYLESLKKYESELKEFSANENQANEKIKRLMDTISNQVK